MAARAETARRKRLLQARIGAGVAGALVLGAVIWIITAVSSGADNKPAASGNPGTATCEWTSEVDPTASPQPTLPPGVKNVGTPPTTVPSQGYQTMTVNTNLGVVKIEMDLSKTPCTAASFTYLASKKFFDNTPCFRLVPSIFALQCGAASNTGGPTYRFADENLPTTRRPRYSDGEVAMANGGPNTNGSQFFFLFGTIDNTETAPLQANYGVWGRVVEGMSIIKQVAAGGFTGSADQGEGPPKKKLTINSVTVSEPTPNPVPAPEPTPAATSPTASPAAS